MAEPRRTRERLIHLAMVLAGALLILVPVLWNGFPLVYADTGTYLRSAFQGFVPVDRPYWYGVFVRITSLGGHTLWGVVVAQALLCSAYIHAILRMHLPRISHIRSLMIIAVLAVFSGLGWYAGQLMPDVFTGIGCLAVYMLLREERSTLLRVLDACVIVIAGWVHLSNLIILPLAGVVLLLAEGRIKERIKRFALVTLVTAVSWCGLAIANYAVDGRAYISRGGHVFLMGRLLETGVLERWLNDHCGSGGYRICGYHDDLPVNAEKFMWEDRSPLAWADGWDSTRVEYNAIVRSAFAEPRYWGAHLMGSLRSTGHQLTLWHLGESLTGQYFRDPTSPPAFMIRNHMEHEYEAYLGSRQNGGNGELNIFLPNLLYRCLMVISLLAAVWLWRKASRDQRALLVFAVAVILVGAWVCASLSMADARYLARASWLLPLCVAVVLEAERKRGPA